jgi:hypothetical protein
VRDWSGFGYGLWGRLSQAQSSCVSMHFYASHFNSFVLLLLLWLWLSRAMLGILLFDRGTLFAQAQAQEVDFFRARTRRQLGYTFHTHCAFWGQIDLFRHRMHTHLAVEQQAASDCGACHILPSTGRSQEAIVFATKQSVACASWPASSEVLGLAALPLFP